MFRPYRTRLFPLPQFPIVALQTRCRPMPDLPRRQMPPLRPPPHSHPSARLFHRSNHFASAKPTAPRSASIPEADEHAQLMRHLTLINQVNPRRNGRIKATTPRTCRTRGQSPPQWPHQSESLGTLAGEGSIPAAMAASPSLTGCRAACAPNCPLALAARNYFNSPRPAGCASLTRPVPAAAPGNGVRRLPMALLTPHIHWPARAQLSPWAAGDSARSRVF